MEKVKRFVLDNLHWFVVGSVAFICAVFLLTGKPNEKGYITVNGGEAVIEEGTKRWIESAKEATINYAENALPAVITMGDGEEKSIEAPTIDSIDGGEILNKENCPEGEECGLGAFIYAPTDTFENFKNYTIGRCWDVDSYASAQCWDLASLHSMNYTKDKRVFSTCGTGAARGMWDCKEQNAGSEYSLVYDVSQTQVGDIGVWEGGTWGHTCFIAGPVVNGYVACYGQNQGSSACPGGGSAANIVNLSIKGFRGAFRPKTYTEPEPKIEPVPVPEPTAPAHRAGEEITYTYVMGDYFSKVLVDLGLDEGNLWGSGGAVQFYTNQLIRQNMLDYRGNVKIGIPFKLIAR